MKGGAIREIVRWYVRTRGAEDIARAVGALPPDLAARLDIGADALGILPSVWYDAQLVHALLDEIVAPCPPQDRRRLIAEAAREGVAQSARGVYGFVLRQIVTPAFYARHIQRLWRMLHDGGHREIVFVGTRAARSRTWDWPGHHPLLCEVTIATMAAVFELTGKKDVVATRVSCVSNGAKECVADVRWRA